MTAIDQQERIGVVLLNLGGPERLDDVEPFLYNLFSDRQIIRLSPLPFLQKPLARLIARRRAPKSRACYSRIGGGSPLTRITTEQASDLAAALAEHGSFLVTAAMRYWQPRADLVITALQRAGISKIVALTLYPHYSVATTGSSLVDLRQAVSTVSPKLQLAEISSWPEEPAYIDCLAELIRKGIKNFGGAAVELVYSAHSLPVKFIEEGDPYVDELRKTIEAVEKITGLPGRLCFQSRSGPVRWLTPSTPEMLETLAAEGAKNVLIVPISFVSDHVETLYEIDQLYKERAKSLGMRLERTDSLNTLPGFIRALQNLVLAASRQHGFLP